jgi:hypothetical protein
VSEWCIPVDFHPGPNHQINSSPSRICQINSDDFGEADDGDKTSTSLISTGIVNMGKGLLKNYQRRA